MNLSTILRTTDAGARLSALADSLVILRASGNTISSMIGVNKSVAETEFHNAFVVNANVKGYAFGDDDRPERINKAFFATVAYFIHAKKVSDENKAVVVVLSDYDTTFKFAAIAKYVLNPNQDSDEGNNWEFTMTFNKSDIEELERQREVIKLDMNSTEFSQMFSKVAFDIACIEFMGDYTYDACVLVIDTLVQILEREMCEVELEGYFIASASVEDDEKILSIEPAGRFKSIAKGDLDTEKN